MASDYIQLTQSDTEPTAGEALPPAGEPQVGDTGHGEGDTHTEVGTAADHGGEHGATFPPFDSSTFASQLVWLAITFGLFYYLMAKVVLPRIAQTLEQRHDRIASDLAEAERLKGETDEAIAAYEQSLAEARQRAGDIARTTRERVQQTIDAERAEAEAALAEKAAEAEKQIAAVKAKAMEDLDSIAAETAEAVVAALGGGKATKAELSKAVSEARK